MKRHPAPKHDIDDKPFHLVETYQPELSGINSTICNEYKCDSKLNDNTFNLLKMRWFNTFEVAQFFRFLIALNWLREHFSKEKKPYRVLVDFGCSRSQLYTFWRNNGNYFGWPFLHYYGVDADVKRLEPGLPHKANDEYHAVLADLSRIIKMPEKADAIVAMEILEHIPKHSTGRFLENIYRNLQNDGIAILSSPNPDKEHGEQWAWKDSEDSHHYEWNIDEFLQEIDGTFATLKGVGLLPRKVDNGISFSKKLKKFIPYSWAGNITNLIGNIDLCKQWMVLLKKSEK